MNTTTTTAAAASTASTSASAAANARQTSALATSVRFRNFAIAFSLGVTMMYLACEWFNLPLFTYHPGTNRVGWGWEAARSGEGPAMYWYGWSATSLLVGLVLGALGALLPEGVGRRIPLFLLWLLPLLVFGPLIYSLMPFWTKG